MFLPASSVHTEVGQGAPPSTENNQPVYGTITGLSYSWGYNGTDPTLPLIFCMTKKHGLNLHILYQWVLHPTLFVGVSPWAWYGLVF